ncbi:MBL fold metallo-hydrolase [Streptosporangium sp. NBC_01756]|uniref:MBL fold metallo-hydrolase n=1 Tax=Streptosporangium sp. NBC_01756 TaxID=2975950 RepID=UPI002DD8974C|nr:MBL fold metallo-hydrolase [Streptosporangium sp. NBC_01756]WSC87425.1 MBL fold metallo-hydrolase [Streptosporangium sp. NBC_01756]
MSSSRHDHPLPPARVEEVSDGVYAYIQPDGSWWINNTGFLVGRRGVISVDACSTERRTLAYREAIRSVTDRPVTTLINTHHHGDHTFGNSAFPEATIVGHEKTREAILAEGIPEYRTTAWTEVDWGDLVPCPPFLTYTDGVTVHSDELRCEVRHLGLPAHTTNDSIVWIPERSLLFAGDLVFNGGTPFVMMGSVQGSITALDRLRELGAETIVPGHGGVCGPEVIDRVQEYLRFVMATAELGRAAGLSPLEAARETDLGEYGGLLDPERIVGNLHRAYAELDGLPPGEPIDVAAAVLEMIDYNGGRLLTCLA